MNGYILHSNYNLNYHKNAAKLHKYINYVQLFKCSASCFLLFQRE